MEIEDPPDNRNILTGHWTVSDAANKNTPEKKKRMAKGQVDIRRNYLETKVLYICFGREQRQGGRIR